MKTQFYKSDRFVQTNGEVHKPGKPFLPDPSGEIGEGWEKVTTVEKAASEASDAMGPGAPDLETLDLASLKAMATERNVDLRGITAKKDIIAALHASYEPRL